MRIGQVFSGEDDLLLHDQGLSAALQKPLRAKWHGSGAAFSRTGFSAFIDHAHFQRGGTAQDVFGFGGVLHARELHHNAVQPLLLNHRFGHAQFVDPVVQGGDVLLEGLVLDPSRRLGLDGCCQLEFGAHRSIKRLQIRKVVLNDDLGSGQGLGIPKADFNQLAIAADAAVAHVLFTQGGANVTGQGLGLLGQRGLHVDLQHEMHAATQIKAQVHGEGMKGREPSG